MANKAQFLEMNVMNCSLIQQFSKQQNNLKHFSDYEKRAC